MPVSECGAGAGKKVVKKNKLFLHIFRAWSGYRHTSNGDYRTFWFLPCHRHPVPQCTFTKLVRHTWAEDPGTTRIMSAPPGRSATVTSLSGRVNALKFMQRASPSSSPSTPSRPTAAAAATATASPSPAASPSASIPGSPSIGAGAIEEEQWSLSPAAIANLRAKAQGQSHPTDKERSNAPRIEQEAGFDAWLINRETQQQQQQTSGSGRRTGHRQTFGVLGKRKQDQNGQEEQEEQEPTSDNRSKGRDRDQAEAEADSLSDEGAENQSATGFVKPGSLKKGDRKSEASASASKRAKKSAGPSKDQDKVVYARKRGGKLGISGGGR